MPWKTATASTSCTASRGRMSWTLSTMSGLGSISSVISQGGIRRRGQEPVERLLDFGGGDDFHGIFAFAVPRLREEARQRGVDQPDAALFPR